MWCTETGVGTSEHWRTRLNPGGIGVTDGGDDGLGWADGPSAARAMLVHLSAYVRGYDPAFWPWISSDPRYVLVLQSGFGQSVRTLADLGNGRWATDPHYARKCFAHLMSMRERDEAAPEPLPAEPSAPTPPPLIQRPSPNWHERNGQRPLALVYHVTDDANFAGSLDWLTKPGSRASAHFAIDRDGTTYQLVASRRAAWTNGEIHDPNLLVSWMAHALQRVRQGANLNDFTIAIEHAGTRTNGFTEPQIAASIALSRYLLAFWKIAPSRSTMLRHSDIDAIERPYCPGDAFPLARIIRACGGDPTSWKGPTQ